MTLAFDASEFHLTDSDIDRSPSHADTLAWRASQMESKSSQRSSKVLQAESGFDSPESVRAQDVRQAAAEDARPVVEKWIEVELPRHAHRRGAAYEAVARLFACHESWIRRLIGRQVRSFDADLYKRIMLSEARADALLLQRARADVARYAGAGVPGAVLPHGEARDAAR